MKVIHLARTLLRRNSWFVGAFQAVLIWFSFTLAWFLSFNLSLPHHTLYFAALCTLIVIRVAMIAGFGLLHGWWRYTGLSDAFDVVRSVLLGSLIFFPVVRYVWGFERFPRSVYILELFLTTGILIGVRLFSRVLAESVRQDLTSSKKVLLIGAGTAGYSIVREIGRNGSKYSVVGFVDDDRSKIGLRIENVPVLGVVDEVPHWVNAYAVDEVLIAVPSASSAQMQRFVGLCERAGVRFRTVPALRDLINENVSISNFRQVDVEDLLGRDPVEIDLESVRSALHDRCIMVTGAAGSIGIELCRQILQHEPRTLICVDHNETGVFYLQRQLQDLHPATFLRCHVADVGDPKRMRRMIETGRPEAIFHAAAYKHVPLMEENVAAAVQNNIFGLMNVLELASEFECRNFVFISSDKAVNPVNVMGATKRIGELIMAHYPAAWTRCLSVRFGNVLGSRGSIVPLLQEQLERKEPLTVTHPEIVRFFMTIHEAVSLVLQASVIGHKGDTLVLDMGEPMPILELVRTLIRLSGQDESEVKLHFSGLRPGEKLAEELFYEEEDIDDTSFPKIKRARGAPLNWKLLQAKLAELSGVLDSDPKSIRMKIQDIVSEYSFSESPLIGLEELSPAVPQRETPLSQPLPETA